MKMFKISCVMLILSFLSCFVFADNADNSTNISALQQLNNKALSPMGNLNLMTPSNVPPGVKNSEQYPSGLATQDKTPAGWSQGKKEGWNKNVKTKCNGKHCTVKNNFPENNSHSQSTHDNAKSSSHSAHGGHK